MLRHILILTIFLLVCNVGQSQIDINYKLEAGISFSQLPRSYLSTNSRNDKIKEITTPLPGPLLGFHGQLTARKCYQFTIGLQYQMTGKCYHYHRDGNDLLYSANYTSDTWENLSFHKLCIPLTIGYNFKTHKINPTIFIGLRPNFILTGRYYYKYKFDHDNNTKDLTREQNFDLFDPNQNAKHFNNQFLLGFSVSTGTHLEFVLNFILGQGISFEKYIGPSPFIIFLNNDFSISIKYKIGQPEKGVPTTGKKLAALNNVYKKLPR